MASCMQYAFRLSLQHKMQLISTILGCCQPFSVPRLQQWQSCTQFGCARRIWGLQRDLHPANGFVQLHQFYFFEVINACAGSDGYLAGRVAFIQLVIEVYSQLLQARLDGTGILELQAQTCTYVLLHCINPGVVPFSGTGCSQDVAATRQTANRCLLAHPAIAPRHYQAWRL